DPNIAMKPQDGSFNFQFNDIKIELRVAALPTAQEEMISLRLFNPNKEAETLNSLGFSNKKVSIIKHMVQQKNGLILSVGTTGSGKSTTLYTILKQLSDQHVITLEDPIEQIIPNIHQTALNENQGYTFDIGLKAILRHNPDVIVIGEIRDQKTAEIALNAAYTGHLVIASLHTNSIEATLLRLENLGCSSFLISYCLRGIISQSLEQNKNKIELKSTLLLCESPYIVNNIKKELQEFIKQNILIQ
ncbi:MAG: ATPase, T2SS/T4P/T4SS family, partial [Candidatus Margulisiibacteriota bacterium]